MKSTKSDKSKQSRLQSNKLCSSCRRTCKQLPHAVVASCPRYYPFKRKSGKQTRVIIWKQMEMKF